MRKLSIENALNIIINTLCACNCIFILFSVYTQYFDNYRSLSIYLTFLLISIYFIFALKDIKNNNYILFFMDLLFVLLSLIVGLYAIINTYDILARAGQPTQIETIFGIIIIILVLEATRRYVGLPLVILSIILLLHTFYGRYMPSLFIHQGFSLERISSQMYSSLSGIFGLPMKVMYKYVALFIIFGSLLDIAGGINFFMNLAMAISGRFRGGMAKISVVASSIMGSISGSAVANVAATGSLTIPSMKNKGYNPVFAASVESTASTGGQLMPPIMGAAAFLMADFLNIQYVEVCLVALYPAILYFIVIFLSIHFYACKHNLMGEDKENIPNVLGALKKESLLSLPIIVIIFVLAIGYSPVRAVYCAIATLILVSYLIKREFFITPSKFIKALIKAGKNSLLVGMASACAGIILGSLMLTGLGAKLSSILIQLSGGNLLFLLFLAMIASIILGMGMTTTVCYIILATLVGPALIQLGVIPIIAHLYIFYFGMLSMITPPVAMAVYAASAISDVDPNKAGWFTFKMAIPIFLIPYFFVYNPGMALIGEYSEIVIAIITSLIGVSLVTSGIMGYLLSGLNIIMRLLLITGGVLLFHGGNITDLIGISISLFGLTIYTINYIMNKKQKALLS